MPRTRRFIKGSQIFEEGWPGQSVFILKSGRVQLSKLVEGEPVVLTTLDDGAVFGEMALLGEGLRTATATALTDLEVAEIDRKEMDQFLAASPPLVRVLLESLVGHLKRTTANMRVRQGAHTFLGVANLLQRLAQNGKAGAPARIGYQAAVTAIQDVLGLSAAQVEGYLEAMARNRLVRLEGETPVSRAVTIPDRETFLARARELERERGGLLVLGPRAGDDLVDAGMLARLLDVPPERLAAKIGQGEVPERFVCFRKEEAVRWAEERGREFFLAPGPAERNAPINVPDLAALLEVPWERIVKKIGLGEVPESLVCFPREDVLRWAEERGKAFFLGDGKSRFRWELMTSLREIVHLDDVTVQEVFGQLDPYRLCRALQGMPPEVMQKVTDNLSRRMAAVVEAEVARAGDVSDDEVAELEAEMVEAIKAYKRNRMAGVTR